LVRSLEQPLTARSPQSPSTERLNRTWRGKVEFDIVLILRLKSIQVRESLLVSRTFTILNGHYPEVNRRMPLPFDLRRKRRGS
jgi:hypothetical protein